MQRANFCAECGDRLARTGWRARLGRRLCDPCTERLGRVAAFRPLVVLVLIAAAAFSFGRYLRPSPPPLIIQRAANSPLSDAPVEFNAAPGLANRNQPPANQNPATVTDDAVYICGARTKKGTPCRRRVHDAGQRCFQHKGMPAMVPLEKLTIKGN